VQSLTAKVFASFRDTVGYEIGTQSAFHYQLGFECSYLVRKEIGLIAFKQVVCFRMEKDMFSRKLVLGLAASAFTFGYVSAQESPPASKAANAVQSTSKLDAKTTGASVRASKLIGMKIQNSRKENVGQIKDLVIDPSTTRIQYVAVTYGGFLGLGDKLFAVPMAAIKVQIDPDNSDKVVLVLDVTKEQMNGDQGFDEQHWPNFSDSKFTGDLFRRYNVEDRWQYERNRDGKVDINVGRDGLGVKVDGKNR